MRKVFFSFDWDDVWRVNQVRNSWVTKGNYTSAGFVDSVTIEKVKRKTDKAIKNWIDQQLQGTSVTCVLIGEDTSNSKWVKYEMQKSFKKGNGLLGIYIHNVKDQNGKTTQKGEDPFLELSFNLEVFFEYYEYYYSCCSYYDWVDNHGHQNLDEWIEKAAKQANR